MKTASLLAALNIAKSSLGANDSVYPVLAAFCFMDDFLYAYNDITAIIVEEKTGLTCALHGDTLLGILGVAGTDDITVSVTDGAASLKLKSGWVKIPAFDAKSFMFVPPEEEPILSIPFSASVAKAVERCLVSVSTDNIRQEFNGVTLRIVDGEVTFFSSDNSTASRFSPTLPLKKNKKPLVVVLPKQACEQMLKLGTESSVLNIGDKFGTFEGDGVVLFMKLLPANIDIFETVFSTHADGKAFTDLPAGFAQELSKARVVLQRETVQECLLEFTPTKVDISAAGVLGSMKASIKGTWPWSGVVCVSPDSILRAVGHATAFCVNDQKSLVLSGKSDSGFFTYLVSSKFVPPPQQESPPPPPKKVKQPAASNLPDDLDDDIPF